MRSPGWPSPPTTVRSTLSSAVRKRLSTKRSPEELYPNLFSKKPAKAAPRELGPADLRLLQWSMKAASRRSASNTQRPAAR